MVKIKNDYWVMAALFLMAFIVLMLGNGIVPLTNPDEVFYAQTAKEMASQHTWNISYLFGQPQFEKPILTYWLLRAGSIVFGASPFAARFFPALFAIFGVFGVYFLCNIVFGNHLKSFVCALVLMFSVFYIGMARSVFTDMIFSVFIFFSMGSFYLSYQDKKWRNPGIILFFIFAALAVLTKGPLGLIIPLFAVIIFLALKKELKFLLSGNLIHSSRQGRDSVLILSKPRALARGASNGLILGFVLFLLVALPWYWFIIARFGNDFIKEFFYNDHIRRLIFAEHKRNDTWFFYPFSIILCMFPWCLFVIASFASLIKKIWLRKASELQFFLFCWIAAVFIIFQVAHSKLVSYVLPLFPALAIITGDYLYEAAFALKGRFKVLSLVTLLLFLLFPIGLIVALCKYPLYVGSRGPLYFFLVVFFILIALEIYFIRKKPLVFLCAVAVNIILLLFLILTHASRFEDYISSKRAGEYLQKICPKDSVILCSKFLVRGVRYFTGNRVAVLKPGWGSFFSPHPILIVQENEEARQFFAKQPNTYCVINKSLFNNLKEIVEDKFEFQLLKIFGDEYVVVIKAR